MRTKILMWALLTVVGLAVASPVLAAPVFCGTNQICYDDQSGTLFDWTGINETITTPDDLPATANDGLYGDPFMGGPNGNELIFDPNNFLADAGVGVDFDSTHALLNMTIMANSAADPIESITLSEFGDYTFAGVAGSASTAVQGTVGGSITVLESTAFGTTPTVFFIDDIGGVLTVTPSAQEIPGGLADSFDNAGIGTVNWAIDYFLDLTGLGVTKVEVQLNNTLYAFSEATTGASIQKKLSFLIVPEPGTFALVSLGMLGLAMRRRLDS